MSDRPKYELHHDRLMGTYTIREVREIGPFDSREKAREWMLARPADDRGAVEALRALRDHVEATADRDRSGVVRDPDVANMLADAETALGGAVAMSDRLDILRRDLENAAGLLALLHRVGGRPVVEHLDALAKACGLPPVGGQ